jgi:hypothetical protein
MQAAIINAEPSKKNKPAAMSIGTIELAIAAPAPTGPPTNNPNPPAIATPKMLKRSNASAPAKLTPIAVAIHLLNRAFMTFNPRYNSVSLHNASLHKLIFPSLGYTSNATKMRE